MSNLKEIQDLVASENFKYGGNSLEMLDIVAAIKDGYRLYKVEDKERAVNHLIEMITREDEKREKAIDDIIRMYETIKERFDYLYYVNNPTEEEILECRILGGMLGRM